jgi:hypothetical protein
VKIARYLVAIVGATVALPAWAATLNYTGGEVFVDRGSGYTPIRNSMTVKPGDIVMAKAGGTADIIYDDGCRQAVELGTVITVGPSSPCAANGPPGDTTVYVLGGLAVATGVGLAIALSGDDDNSASAQ